MQLTTENEALSGRIHQLATDIHELKSDNLSKELQRQNTSAELELRVSQVTAAELNAKHELWLARERITVMEDELRHLSDTNSRLAGRCNSAQIEASQASQKLHVSRQELSSQMQLCEDRLEHLQQELCDWMDERAAEAGEIQQESSSTLQHLQERVEELQVRSDRVNARSEAHGEWA